MTVIRDRAEHLRVSGTPIRIDSCAWFPFSQRLENRLVQRSRYDEPVSLSWRVGDLLAIPRALCSEMGEDRRAEGWRFPFNSEITPRSDEQLRVIQEAGQLLLAGHSFLLEAPTGFGKTVIGCDLMGWLERSTLIVVSQQNHRDQWIEALQKFLGLERAQIGVWQADNVPNRLGVPVAVAMLHSVCKRGRYPPWLYDHFGFLIFDECHRLGATEFSKAAQLLRGKWRLGLSATTDRKDGKEFVFHAHIGPVMVESEALPMIPRVIRFKTKLKLPMKDVWDKNARRWTVRTVEPKAGKTTWVDKILASSDARNAQLADVIRYAYSKERNLLVLCRTLKQIDHLERLAIKAGVPEEEIGRYVGGMTGPVLYASAAKPVILATYAYAATGTDFPWWDACLLATPSADVQQAIGRVLREYPGKPQPLVIDPVDPGIVWGRFAKQRRKFYERIGAQVNWTDHFTASQS